MKIYKLSAVCIFLILASCNTPKKLYESKAYDRAIEKLTDKNTLNESQVAILTQSYHQANQDDFTKIMELKKSGQPDIWLEIYKRSCNINARQEKVDKLPKATKDIINYKKLALDEEIQNAKSKAEIFLNAKAQQLLKEPNETNIKEAATLIKQLRMLNPKNQNLDELYVKLIVTDAERLVMRIATPTDLDMPDDFALLALDFEDNTIHNTPFDIIPNDSISYDIMVRIMIEEKEISPERVDAVTFEERKDDKIAKVTDKTMSKSATIKGKIEFIDVKEESILIETPFDISSTFRYNYAVFEGDREACSEQTISLSKNKVIDFPSDTALLRDIARKLNETLKTEYQKK